MAFDWSSAKPEGGAAKGESSKFDWGSATEEAPKPEATAGGLIRSLAASAVDAGIGFPLQAGGEVVAAGLNKVTGTENFRAENPLGPISKMLRDNMSEGDKLAAQDVPKGDILSPSTWELPETGAGMAHTVASGAGSLGSMLIPGTAAYRAGKLAAGATTVAEKAAAKAAIKRATATGAVAGAATTGGAAANEVREGVDRLTDDQLYAQSPKFKELVDSGVDRGTARQTVENTGAQAAGAISGVAGGLSGALNAKLLEDVIAKRGIPAIIGNLSQKGAVRAGVGAGVGAVAEGAQEAAEKVGQNIGENIGMGNPALANATRDTFGDALGGALIGGPIGAVGGAVASPGAGATPPAGGAPPVPPVSPPQSPALGAPPAQTAAQTAQTTAPPGISTIQPPTAAEIAEGLKMGGGAIPINQDVDGVPVMTGLRFNGKTYEPDDAGIQSMYQAAGNLARAKAQGLTPFTDTIEGRAPSGMEEQAQADLADMRKFGGSNVKKTTERIPAVIRSIKEAAAAPDAGPLAIAAAAGVDSGAVQQAAIEQATAADTQQMTQVEASQQEAAKTAETAQKEADKAAATAKKEADQKAATENKARRTAEADKAKAEDRAAKSSADGEKVAKLHARFVGLQSKMRPEEVDGTKKVLDKLLSGKVSQAEHDQYEKMAGTMERMLGGRAKKGAAKTASEKPSQPTPAPTETQSGGEKSFSAPAGDEKRSPADQQFIESLPPESKEHADLAIKAHAKNPDLTTAALEHPEMGPKAERTIFEAIIHGRTNDRETRAIIARFGLPEPAAKRGDSQAPEGRDQRNADGADTKASANAGDDNRGTGVDAGAHEAASSPRNDKTATKEQILGGNAELGHVNIAGLDISIENPEGSTRTDLQNDPPQWSTKMKAHYGYIKGTIGKDKDHLDVFIKPGTPEDFAGQVFVIDQKNADGGFDEHKIMLGYAGLPEALKAYKAHYPKGWDGIMGSTGMTMAEFKEWIKGDTTKPVTKQAAPLQSAMESEGWAAEDAGPENTHWSKRVGNERYTAILWQTKDKKQAHMEVTALAEGGVDTQIASFDVTDAGAAAKAASKAVADDVEGQQDELPPEMRAYEAKAEAAEKAPAKLPEPQWWKDRTGAERVFALNAAGIKGTAMTPWNRLSADNQRALNEQWGPKEAPPAPPKQQSDRKEIGKNRDGATLYEDWRGVRTLVQPGETAGTTETVQMRPTRSGMQITVMNSSNRPEEYKTVEELAAEKPAEPTKERWESYVIRPTMRNGEMFVSEPRGDGTYQNLASFKVKADGQPGRIGHFYESPQTRGPVEQAVERWAEQQKQPTQEAAPKAPAKSPEQLRAEADLMAGLADLADIFGKNAKLNMLPEQQQKIGPVLTRVFDAAFRLGYIKFKQAAKFVLDTIRTRIGPEIADQITIDDLQGAYIGMAQNYKDKGADPGKVVVAVESLAELETGAEQAQNGPSNGPSQTPAPGGASNRPLESAPSKDVRTPEGSGNTGTDGAGSGTAVDGRKNQPDAAGDSGRLGLGNGAGAVPPVAGGAGSKPGSTAVGGPAANAGNQSPDVQPGQRQTVAKTDYRITEKTRLGEGGQKTKYANNLAAIQLVKRLQAEDRGATPDEQHVLARYVGWGGIPQAFDKDNAKWAAEYKALKDLLTPEEWQDAFDSTQFAHYTAENVIGAIYQALGRLGFKGNGRFLEAGSGVGNFVGLAPKEMLSGSRFTGIERDAISGAIAQYLYPNQSMQVADFTRWNASDGTFDVAIGNPPFSRNELTDASGRKHLSRLRVHNYFFAKSIDLLRDGGIFAEVVSNGFMDSREDRARKYIGERTRLLGAIRLPNNAFKGNANTEVTTDIVFLQKLPQSEWGSKEAKADAKRWMDLVNVPDPLGGADIPVNRYFAENPTMMLGRMERAGSMYGPDQPALIARNGEDITKELARAIKNLPEGIYQSAAVSNTAAMEKAQLIAMSGLNTAEGGYFVQDGKLYQRAPDIAGEQFATLFTPETQWTEKTTLGDARHARLVQMAEMALLTRQLIAAEISNAEPDMLTTMRADLNQRYDAYVGKHGPLNARPNLQLYDEDPELPLLLSLERDYDPGIAVTAAKKQGIKPIPPSAKKADILSKRVNYEREAPDKADSPADAVMISIAERGRIDADYIAQLLGQDADGILQELAKGDKPALFLDPASNGYVLADEYLSGNVRKKLLQAKAAHQFDNVRALEAVIPADIPGHQIYGKVGANWVPTDVYEAFARELFGDTTQAGIRYVKVNSSYIVDIEGASEIRAYRTYGVRGKFAMDEKGNESGPELNFSGPRILAQLLNNKEIKVGFYDDDHKFHLSKRLTDEANDKAAAIRERFSDWLMSDPDRSERLTREYNDVMNNYVARRYDGSMLRFPGKVPDEVIKFRKHQRNAISRIMQDRQALLDHVVGAGKTFTVVSAAMEMRRTGLARKPVITVPNHLVKQWASDFYRLYPGAKILAATKKDFEKLNRRRFLAKIATGDWDAVILAHSSFGFIKPPAEFEERFAAKQIDVIIKEIEAMGGEGDGKRGKKTSDDRDSATKRTVKQLAAMRDRLKERVKRLRDKPMDDLLDFEQLGADMLFVDEAHLFKNLMFATKMNNVRGMGLPEGSQRAYDMYIKTQYIMEKYGKGVVFATGTPVSNSLAEMYHMLRYLAPQTLEDMHHETFDAWVNTFASVESVWMQALSGEGFKSTNRLDKFVNAPELLKVFGQVADTVTMDDIKAAYREENAGKEFPLPPLKGDRRTPVSLPITKTQQEFMEDIAKRAKALEKRRGPPKKGEDNMLSIMGDARRGAIDIRMVNTDIVERDPDGRLAKVAANVLERHKQYNDVKGTQLIFSDLGTPLKHAKKELAEYEELQARAAPLQDESIRARADLGDEEAVKQIEDAEAAVATMEANGKDWLDGIKIAMRGFSVYDDLRKALMEGGIPDGEIAFIHDYNTDEQKAALFRAVNQGKVRVLLGSTAKLGAGTNVQERLVALHHVDVPWKPSDIEQREGRIVRQGNLLPDLLGPDFAVEIQAYVTQDTLDLFMWQLQEAKLNVIGQIRTGKVEREIDNAFEEMQMSAGEMQAAATSDPLLMQEIRLKDKIKKLERQKKSFEGGRNDLINRLKRAEQDAARLPSQIERATALKQANDLYQAGIEAWKAEQQATINGVDIIGADAIRKTVLDAIHAIETPVFEKYGYPYNMKTKVEKSALSELVRAAWKESGVTFNGKTYHSDASVADAVRDLLGDVDTIAFTTPKGEVLHRRSQIDRAIESRVVEALTTDGTATVGKFGDIEMVVEGYHKGDEIFGEVTLKFDGREESIGASKFAASAKLDEAAPPILIRSADNALYYASNSVADLERRKQDADRAIEDAKKHQIEEVWPKEAELTAARQEYLTLLNDLRHGKSGIASALDALYGPGHGIDALMNPIASRAKRGAGRGVSVPELTRLAAVMGGNIKIAATQGDLPESASRFRSEISTGVRGVFIPKTGEIYLVAENLQNLAEGAFVAMHEGAHRGLRKLFGPELKPVLNRIWMGNKNVRTKTAEYMAQYNIDKMEAIEEVLADMAMEGTAKDLTGWEMLVEFIKTWVAKFGDMIGAKLPITDDMVEIIVSAASRKGLEGDAVVFDDALADKYSKVAPTFYSALADAVAKIPARALTPEAWWQNIESWNKKGVVKNEELQWSEVEGWLSLQSGKVTKEQFLSFLRENGVKVETVRLGGKIPESAVEAVEKWMYDHTEEFEAMDYRVSKEDMRGLRAGDAEVVGMLESFGVPAELLQPIYDNMGDGATKFSNWKLPGGDEYREVLMTLPEADAITQKRALMEQQHDAAKRGDTAEVARLDRLIDAASKQASGAQQFRSNHWDQPNVVAHFRADVVTGADGKRYLRPFEFQSDWGQQGKKNGFKQRQTQRLSDGEWRTFMQGLREEYAAQVADKIGITIEEGREIARMTNEDDLAKRVGKEEEFAQMAARRDDDVRESHQGGFVPTGPFVTKTEAWLSLAIKRAIRMAADEGLDGVVFANGQQMADLFDLSKRVDQIRAVRKGEDQYSVSAVKNDSIILNERDIDSKRLADLVGKELAEKISGHTIGERKDYSGLDLKVGGVGMRAFYDKIVPNVANDVLRKLGGGKVGMIELRERDTYDAEDGPQPGFESTQPGFPITDALRERALAGMPLFSRLSDQLKGMNKGAGGDLFKGAVELDGGMSFRDKQVSSPAFKNWFGDSKIVDANGRPLVVYHRSGPQADFESFVPHKPKTVYRAGDQELIEAMSWDMGNDGQGAPDAYHYMAISDAAFMGAEKALEIRRAEAKTSTHPDTLRLLRDLERLQGKDVVRSTEVRPSGDGSYFTPDPGYSFIRQPGAGAVYPVYLRIENPLYLNSSQIEGAGLDFNVEKYRAMGYDGAIFRSDPTDLTRAKWGEFTQIVIFDGNQAKSAISNNGNFDPNEPGIMASRPGTIGATWDMLQSAKTPAQARALAMNLFDNPNKFNLWDKTIGTQLTKARKNEYFRAVFDALQAQQDSTAAYAIEAEAEAADVLARMEGMGEIKSALKSTFTGLKFEKGSILPQGERARDLQAVSKAIFSNIEGRSGVKQRVFTDFELKRDFDLNDRQIALYRQSRAAIDRSLDRYAQSLAVRMAQKFVYTGDLHRAGLDDTVEALTERMQLQRQVLEDQKEPGQSVEDMEARLEELKELRQAMPREILRSLQVGPDGETRQEFVGVPDTAAATALEKEIRDVRRSIERGASKENAELDAKIEALDAALSKLPEIAEQANSLKDKGYAPAMRFGDYAVTATQGGETVFFTMVDTKTQANLLKMRLAREMPGAELRVNPVDRESFKLFGGVDPATVELFARFMEVEENDAFKAYIALATSSRSALKHMLERKGIAGFSDNLPRVMAAFITSNSRAAARNIHGFDVNAATEATQKNARGDVSEEAAKLVNYMNNPTGDFAKVRGFMFAYFMGGSVSSALVNLTQPLMMTTPYLEQFAGKKIGGIMVRASKASATGKVEGPMKAALARAEAEGITDAHEYHQLMQEAEGGGSVATRALMKSWGSMFGAAERFNRRITFLAAFETGQGMTKEELSKQGVSDAYEFAANAVAETQGIYARHNRPNWARNPVGALAMTFKQYSISWVEFFIRLPRKQQLMALGLLTLMAGLEGLPFAEDLEDLIDTIGQRMGRGTNSKKALRQAATNILGETGAQFALHGISGLAGMPMDVAGRLGMGNLIPGTKLLNPSIKDKGREALEIVGPAGGLAQKAAGILDGNVKEAMPKAFADAAKAWEMLQTGEYRDTRGRKVMDVDGMDSLMKMIGFQPAALAADSRRIGESMRDIDIVKRVESEITSKWAQGIIEKDPAKVEEAKKQLIDWNQANADMPIRVGSPQIGRRVREAMVTRDVRFIKTAPPEMRANIMREMHQ